MNPDELKTVVAKAIDENSWCTATYEIETIGRQMTELQHLCRSIARDVEILLHRLGYEEPNP